MEIPPNVNVRLLLQALRNEASVLDGVDNLSHAGRTHEVVPQAQSSLAARTHEVIRQAQSTTSGTSGTSLPLERGLRSDGLAYDVRSSLVDDQVSQLFQPYSEQGSSSTLRREPPYFRSAPYNNVVRLQQFRASTVGSSRRGSVTPPVARIWEGKVMFLGDPSEQQKPDQVRRRALQEAKLGGPSGLSFDVNQSNDALMRAIMNLFDHDCSKDGHPNSTTPGFTFRLSFIEEQHDKMLTFFKQSFVPTHLKMFGIKKIYAVPSMTLLPLEIETHNDEDFATVVGGSGNESDGASVGVGNTSAESPSLGTTGGFHFHENLSHITDIDHLRRHLDFLYPGFQYIESPPIGNSDEPLCLLLPKFLTETICDQKASIIQENTETVDLGGPLKSFVWKLGVSVHEDKFNNTKILEGNVDRRSISSCVCLEQDRIFTMLGRFIAFSIRNLGVCLLGLSKLSIRMLCSSEDIPPSAIDVDDLCDAGDRTIVSQMQEQLERGVMSSNLTLRYEMQSFLSTAHWTYPLNIGNLRTAIDYMKTYKVVTCKKQVFRQLREGFLSTDTGKWVATHPECWEALFPRLLNLQSKVADVMSAIEAEDDVPAVLLEYMHEYFEKNGQIAEFLEAVTGHPYLLGGNLSIVVDNTLKYFKAFTCSSQLQVFECPCYSVFEENLNFFLGCAKVYTHV